MKKLTGIIKYTLLAVSVIVTILVFTGGEQGVGIDLALAWTGLLLALGVAITLVMSAMNLSKNPKGATGSLIGLGVMVLVIVVSYILSSAEPIVTPVGTFDDPATLKITDTGLYVTYAALGLALLAAIVGEVRNSFK